ncbi:ATP-binding protein [Neobacillus jeddahensis]|uniref:ATP-binding protein n=1 Tax=Neobacillus jeddahensis TaxID=1461580 RepID=UPI00058B9214|nr:ATP-binding protein [Neobacillus jeddahensis]
MKESSKSPKLIYEEKKAIKLFLWLFNIIFFSWEIFYYYIMPFISRGEIDFSRDGFGISYYIVFLLVLTVSIYFTKKKNVYIVKYIYLISYLFIDLIDNLIRYLGTDKHFTSGNIVEVLFILFSPIFVNKKYFWMVSIGLVSKDLLFGLILQDTFALVPALTYLILSLIAYIILTRFYSYISSLMRVNDELRKKEKLAIIGQMATAIGHEIRNPLASLKGFTQLQQERYLNTNDYYPIMIQEIDRINSIVDDLMYIGKPKAILFEKASIEEIIAYTLSITQQMAEGQGIMIETTLAGPLPPLECDSKQLKQVFLNLIKNAIESMQDGGKIKVHVYINEEKQMSISIKDEGCGIAEEHILNVGEPFFTTKKEGTGLGLMVTSQIIKDHNGKLEIESEIGKGTRIHVILPVLQKNVSGS